MSNPSTDLWAAAARLAQANVHITKAIKLLPSGSLLASGLRVGRELGALRKAIAEDCPKERNDS